MRCAAVHVLLLTFAAASASAATPADDQARELAWGAIQAWVASPAVTERVREQNAAHRALGEREILDLDEQWRSELKLDPGQRALINRVLGRPLSALLRERADGTQGLVRELFVMDSRGLLVGTSRITSDYWQGDEDKWLSVFRRGEPAHVGEIARDESTQTYLVHVSFPIAAAGSAQPIGAITVGLNAERLARKP
jgi:hypothetical protein